MGFLLFVGEPRTRGRITKNNVFKRSYEKYHERILGIKKGNSWEDIKKHQKDKLRLEEKEFQR